jgi:RNA polymerase sigma-70 factor (ECF subfamily)
MTDTVLARIARGEAAAVRDCMEQFGGLVWTIARRFTRSRADAEDAVQEIFTDVWRSAARFDPAQGSEKVFITTIARRRLIDRMRRGQLRLVAGTEQALDSISWADPGTRAEICAEAASAAQAVSRLRPEQRRVIELGVLNGYSHQEIADALQMPLGTVKTQMRRGLIQVREWMGIERDESTGEERP